MGWFGDDAGRGGGGKPPSLPSEAKQREQNYTATVDAREGDKRDTRQLEDTSEKPTVHRHKPGSVHDRLRRQQKKNI